MVIYHATELKYFVMSLEEVLKILLKFAKKIGTQKTPATKAMEQGGWATKILQLLKKNTPSLLHGK